MFRIGYVPAPWRLCQLPNDQCDQGENWTINEILAQVGVRMDL